MKRKKEKYDNKSKFSCDTVLKAAYNPTCCPSWGQNRPDDNDN